MITIVSFRGLLDDLIALGIQKKGVSKFIFEQTRTWTHHYILDIGGKISVLRLISNIKQDKPTQIIPVLFYHN